MLTFHQVCPTAPQEFRYVMIREDLGDESVYAAQGLEWGEMGTGSTPEQAVANLEWCIMGRAAILAEYPDSKPQPAGEDYQRVATSGEWYVLIQPEWVQLYGTDRLPIVARGVIDMAKSKMRFCPPSAT